MACRTSRPVVREGWRPADATPWELAPMHHAPARTPARTLARLAPTALVAALLLAGSAACSSSTEPTATTAGTGAPAGTSAPAGSVPTIGTGVDATATTVGGGPTVPTSSTTVDAETGLPPTPYAASGVACVSRGGTAGEPLLVTVTGTLADDPADGTIVIRVLDLDELVDIEGTIVGGAFMAAGPILEPGAKEVVEAFVETAGGETLDVTIAVREHFGDAIEVTTTPGAIAGSGTCPAAP